MYKKITKDRETIRKERAEVHAKFNREFAEMLKRFDVNTVATVKNQGSKTRRKDEK